MINGGKRMPAPGSDDATKRTYAAGRSEYPTFLRVASRSKCSRSAGAQRDTAATHHRTNEEMNSAQYWIKLRLPNELDGLNMQQLTAVRKLVQGAFTAGKKDERKAKVTK